MSSIEESEFFLVQYSCYRLDSHLAHGPFYTSLL